MLPPPRWLIYAPYQRNLLLNQRSSAKFTQVAATDITSRDPTNNTVRRRRKRHPVGRRNHHAFVAVVFPVLFPESTRPMSPTIPHQHSDLFSVHHFWRFFGYRNPRAEQGVRGQPIISFFFRKIVFIAFDAVGVAHGSVALAVFFGFHLFSFGASTSAFV